MASSEHAFSNLLSNIIDNRGKTCPTAASGIPLIATNCVKNDALYPAYENVRYVDDLTYRTWFRGHPAPGDMLFVTKGSPGRVCMVPDPVDFCIAQDMVAIRADEKKVYPRFLFALLRTRVVQESIESLHVGTLIPHFKKGDFDKLILSIPERRTQEFVGDVYFELSAKIDVNRRMNETLEGMARALFKAWFVNFEPVRAKAAGRETGLPREIADLFPDSFEDSELGEVPKGWEVATIEDLAALNPESWSNDTRPEVLLYVDLSNTKWGRIDSVVQYQRQDAPSRAQRVLRPGDTIIGTVRPGNGSYAYVTDDGLTGSTGFAVLRPRAMQYCEFVYMAGTTTDNIETLAHLADGGAYPAIRPDVVGATQVVRADDRVLAQFSRATGPLLARIAQCERESRSLAAVRDALLPKLISGEVRVKGAERFVKGDS